MRQEYRDANNCFTGWSDDVGDQIHYYSVKHGYLGVFTKSRKSYYRVKTYPGADFSPWIGTDYGVADIMYWSTQP